MQPVIEQATQALQLGRFEAAKTLAATALAETALPAARLPLLEVFAQAQAGLQEHAAAAGAWQKAYQHAVTPDDKARLFEQARQTIRDQQDYATLLHLAQEHLAHVRTPQEHAVCLLTSGEALIHLQRYQEARQQYLEPALELPGVVPETRLHLWHYLGLSHLAEHMFTAAAAAFRQSADLALGQHFASAAVHLAAQRAQLHHLRNAARFYEGVIHLIYQRPQQAIQSLQELQRPLTAVGTLNVALFLGLAYCALRQPEAATRALQALARPATCPETLRGPAAVVRMGIANIHAAPATLGEHLEAALEAALQPRTSWEPSWRALLSRELGLVFHRLGCREAAIACYEDGLHVIAQRIGIWDEAQPGDALQGAGLLTALADHPVQTWSAVVQGEMLQLLQGLAWLYDQTQDGALADTALTLALRVTTTPAQEVALWCQRGWQMATAAPESLQERTASGLSQADILAGLQRAQTRCADTALAPVVEGIEALLQGDAARATAAFVHIPTVPEVPELQALCVAAWLWAHTQQNTLDQVLAQGASTASLPWQTSTVLAIALETLLAWMTQTSALPPSMPWLAALLAHQPVSTLEALRLLCRPGYLPAPQHAVLMAALRRVGTPLEPPTSDTSTSAPPRQTGGHLRWAAIAVRSTIADQVAMLLGGTVLVERVETLLADLDQSLTAPPVSPPSVARHRKQRQRRSPTPTDSIAAETAHVLQLINLLHNMPQAAVPEAVESSLPEVICRWLLRYNHVCTHAPEVVGALLGLLRQCPGAAAVIPVILEQVALSRRQRQALEAALHAPPEATTTTPTLLAWDGLAHWPLGRLLDTLSDLQRPADAGLDAAVALVLARVGLVPRAVAYLQAGLQRQPEHPLAHYQLAQFLRAQNQPEAALQHLLQAWQSLKALEAPTQFLHLEMLNQLLMLLETTAQYERFPEWLEAFAHHCAALQQTSLSPAQQQRLHEAEGACVLLRASYLAASSSPVPGEACRTASQQLACLEQAVALGAPHTRHVALHRQAELLARLYHYEAAVTTYNDLVQQWPDDQRARQRRDVLTILQQPRHTPGQTERILDEALTLAFTGVSAPPIPVPLTPHSALAWLQEAPRQAPHVVDVIDLLTAYGGVAVQRQEWQRAIEVLTPLYAMSAQPRQAYYLAVAYYARSKQATPGVGALHDSERALQYVQYMLKEAPALAEAPALLRQIEAHHQTLMTVRQQEQDRAAYRQRVCGLFAQHGVRFQAHTVDRAPHTPWVELHEVADLDDTSGTLVTIVQLLFNGQAVGAPALPDETDVVLYAQHQRDKQRLVDTHGIEALPWPHTAYEGVTDFAALFPERLALNRDVLFIAFAELHALLRYARVLQYIFQGLPTPEGVTESPSATVLAATARYLTLIPLLRQRLQTLAAVAPSKVVQRQISGVRDSLPGEPTPEQLQHFPAFVDAYIYFHAIVDTMRAHLDTPPAERQSVQSEERQPQRPARRKRRQGKERSRAGEAERWRESHYSDVL